MAWQMARELTRKVIERRVTQNGELRTCERLPNPFAIHRSPIEERAFLTQGLKREELNIDYCLLTIEEKIPIKQGLKPPRSLRSLR